MAILDADSYRPQLTIKRRRVHCESQNEARILHFSGLSVPYALRFLFASDSASLSESLGIVYRAIAAFQIKKAGLTQKNAQCGSITLIQRFGSALNFNIHFHMIVPDGVYLRHRSAVLAPSVRAHGRGIASFTTNHQ